MASGNQTTNGKAFEYACLMALNESLKDGQDVVIEDTPQLATAKGFYEGMNERMQSNLTSAANAAARVILRLEPQLEYPNKNVPLYLSLQTDARGIQGDVRDVLCIRKQNGWEIGLSCKHNHHAVKHSRLSSSIDFGKEWFGVPCSKQYFSEVNPLFTELKELRDEGRRLGKEYLWADIENKSERYYIPILNAFIKELKRIDEENPNIPAALINYLIGRNDFYKIITDDRHRTTRVEAVNISGTLNRPSEKHKSIVDVARLKLPSRFYHVGIKPDSDTTLEVVCDEGWNISMRIHSAKSTVEPSLKFDVKLIALPQSLYAQVEPW